MMRIFLSVTVLPDLNKQILQDNYKYFLLVQNIQVCGSWYLLMYYSVVLFYMVNFLRDVTEVSNGYRFGMLKNNPTNAAYKVNVLF